MSLRSRLALLFGLVALAVSAVVGFSSYRATRAELVQSTDMFLERRAIDVAQGTRPSPQRDGRNAGRPLGDIRRAPSPFGADSIVQLIDADGGVVASTGTDLPVTDAARSLLQAPPGRDVVGRHEDIEIDGEQFRMYSRSLVDGRVIQVARSVEEDLDVLRRLAGRLALITIVATAAASMAGWWIARRATAPLRRLADVAGRVSQTGDVSLDVPVERSDEIGNLAGSFRQMLATLNTSREQQQRLIHDAAHELRTPLTSLRANVDLLERAHRPGSSPLSGEDQAEVLAAVRSEMGELSSLFDELIELATDGSTRDVPMEPIDLDDVVRRSADRWARRTGREIVVTSEPALVVGNEAMLERAIANLIGNAHKFSPTDAPIEVVASDGRVSVRDHGPGVPPADRDRVFDRFYRTDLTRTMPGSGLGLAIVAQIVDHHGGTVQIGETPAGGADVGFVIPLAAASNAAPIP